MRKITATFRIVTPMFIAGADQQCAELRAPSFKGALRWWYRALYWDSFLQEQQNELGQEKTKSAREKMALQCLSQEESEIFGDAGEAGQSKVLIRVKNRSIETISGDGLLARDVSRKYLGFGLFAMRDIKGRLAVRMNHFDVEFLVKKSVSAKQVERLEQSIKVIGLLGGLGARSRNGFGSIALERLDEKDLSGSRDDYKNKIQNLLSRVRNDSPPFTALSQSTRFILGPNAGSSDDAHSTLGRLYKNFRAAYPHDDRKRSFGLPLYGDDTRRASPLLFHIHPVRDAFVPIVAYFPASRFLPNNLSCDTSLIDAFIQKIVDDEGWMEISHA